MANPPKYFIVEAAALPEIFRKVAETKRLLETGEAETVHQATGITGISRSAFYNIRMPSGPSTICSTVGS